MPARSKALRGFTEAEAWKPIGDGWRRLFGGFKDLGFTFEWHDFESDAAVDWGRSFHPHSLEICLNLAGVGKVQDGADLVEFAPLTSGFYFTGASPLPAERSSGERHQFITLELSMPFLRHELGAHALALHPIPRALLEDRNPPHSSSKPARLSAAQQETIRLLRKPPVSLAAQTLWYQARALDLMVDLLFQPAAESNMFCTRQKQLARDRVAQVVAILKRDLAEPPSLDEVARQVGCSSFYLSRTFSQEMGGTISQHLRSLRMEKAAELLRSGQYNVTEAAMEVGYSSLSHFSVAFHETFGCCPGLYPLGMKK